MCQNNSYMFVSRNFDWLGQRISFTGVPIFSQTDFRKYTLHLLRYHVHWSNQNA